MTEIMALARRNLKEIVRDPLSALMSIGFPMLMLIGLNLIFRQVPSVPTNFLIENYSVGICVFGYTFVMLFVANMIGGDKGSEFLSRIYMSPVSKTAYLFSFVVAALPMIALQTVTFFVTAILLGLAPNAGVMVAMIYLLPSAVMYITFGILIGNLCKSERQAAPICSMLVSATGMLGGVFLPLEITGSFERFAHLLPFSHSIDIAKGALGGDFGSIMPHILWVVGYTLVAVAVIMFRTAYEKN